MRRAWVLGLTAIAIAACARRASLTDPTAKAYAEVAPDSFDVELLTTKGPILVRLHRAWSPLGVDRFHALVRQRYFTDVAFHRTLKNYVAQFGIHGDTNVNNAWRGRLLTDEPVKSTNTRGRLSYARSGPNSRGTQFYFNMVDNSPRLDTIAGIGFPPIGEIVEGLAVLDSLNWEYSGTRGGETFPGPNQDSLARQGNAYLRRAFPRLDYIVTARVTKKY